MKKVLVIEDEDNVRDNIIEILTFKGFEVDSASNGKEGVIAAQLTEPDIIICDIMMPEMDGFEVLQKIRETEAIAQTPFIFLSAKTERADTRRGMTLGADDYLWKPFTVDELIQAINSRLSIREKLQDSIGEQVKKFSKDIYDVSINEYTAPMNGIVGLSDLLIKNFDSFDKKIILEILNNIYNSGRRLQKTLSNALLYNAIQAREYNPELKQKLTTGVCEITPTFIELLVDELIRKYEKRFSPKIQIEKCKLNISPYNFQVIVEELLDNAIKFCDKKPNLRIEGRIFKEKYVFTVHDNGLGIRETDIDQIGPYRQFHKREALTQGSGLGLWLAKQLVILNNGNLFIESVVDEGTSISVELPL